MRITNIQKKELSDIFHSKKLNLIDFEISGEYSEFKVKFKHDYFSFSVVKVRAEEYTMSVFSVANTGVLTYNGKWDVVRARFAGWIQKVHDELNTETGWESFETVNFLNEEYIDLEEKFSSSEKIEVKANILNLKIRIQSLTLPVENLKIIEKKLDDLSSQVETLSKFDWKSQFIGVFASLIMSAIIPQEFSGVIWTYIKNAFSGLKIEA